MAFARHLEMLGRDILDQDPVGAQISKTSRDIFKNVTGRTLDVVSLGRFFRDWAETAGRVKSPRTATRYQQVIEDFLAHMGKHRESASIGSVTIQEIQSFLNKQTEMGKSASTVQIAAKVLGIPFNRALKQGIITTNPVYGAERPQGRSEEKKPFAWDEVEKLIGAAQGEWKTTVLLGARCGMRLGDCVNLKWSNVDLENKRITYLPKKNENKRNTKEIAVPFLDQLADHLTELAQKGQNPEDFLSPKLQKRSVSGRSGLSREFIETIMKDAGIERGATGRQITGVGRQFSKLSFHSLRHFFVTEMGNQGVPQDIRRALAGHASDKMSDRYTHFADKKLREAVAKLSPQKSQEEAKKKVTPSPKRPKQKVKKKDRTGAKPGKSRRSEE